MELLEGCTSRGRLLVDFSWWTGLCVAFGVVPCHATGPLRCFRCNPLLGDRAPPPRLRWRFARHLPTAKPLTIDHFL
jgi:hypothetical protein